MEENLFRYPAMLNLNSKRCAVIGGGKVALRKTRTLVAAGANITVIAPAADENLTALAADGKIELVLRRQIAAEAPCLVNVVTEPELGNFSVPAQSTSGRLSFTAFGGGLPAYTALLARDIARTYGDDFAEFAEFLHEARTRLQQSGLTPKERTAFWRKQLTEEAIGLLHEGRLNTLKERINNAIDSFRAEP